MNESCIVCFLDKNGKVEHKLEFSSMGTNSSMSTNSKKNMHAVSLYGDDTIQCIKEKILYGTKDNDAIKPFSLEEMYLYVISERPFVLLDWYKHVTENETRLLTREMFCQLLVNFSNIPENDGDALNAILQSTDLQEKDVLTYEDILEFPWFRERTHVYQKIPLGIRMEVTLRYSGNKKTKRVLPVDELFSGNPYDILPTTDLELSQEHKTAIVLDQEFLFHYSKKSPDNTIYICLAEDLLQDVDTKLAAFYFPLLHKKNIAAMPQLLKEKNTLRERSLEVVQKQMPQFHRMDIFYQVHRPFPFREQGIHHFVFQMENHQYYQAKLRVPLESLFKNIHASVHLPFIQFVSGGKQEPMLRLYQTQTANTGEKIPHLSSKLLLEMCGEKTGKKTQLVMYAAGVENPSTRNDYVQVILEQNGNLQLRGTLDTPMAYDAFQGWLRDVCLVAFQDINEYLLQSGYGIRLFTSLKDPYLRVASLSLKMKFDLKQKLDLDSHLKCLSVLLSSEPNSKLQKEGEAYRYKRVEHFQVMDDEEEFLSQLLKITQDKDIVEQQLRRQYPGKSRIEIRQMLNHYASKYRTIHGRFINRKSESLAHSGFPIRFVQPTFGNECTVEITQIDSIEYIALILKYVESVLLMSQMPEEIPNDWKPVWNDKTGRLGTVTKESTSESDSGSDSDESRKEDEPSLFQEKPTRDVDEDEDEFEEEEDLDDFLGLIEEDEEDEANVELTETATQKHDEFGTVVQDPEGEEEEEGEEEQDFSLGGGANVNGGAKADKKPDNLRSYFTKRIQSNDPKLFEEMDGYSSICQESQRRQPILITQAEKEKYEAKYPNKEDRPYTKELKYGKDKDGNDLHYICPRFWCSKPGQEGPLTQKEVESGVCGNIISNTGKPKEGEYVYSRDFNQYVGDKLRDAPSFVTAKNKDGKNVCYPCCFQKQNEKKIQECAPDDDPAGAEGDGKKKRANDDGKKAKLSELRISQYKREKLGMGKHGRIPVSILDFMNLQSTQTCIVDNYLKMKCPTFVRYGLEDVPIQQSFMACMADLYAWERKMEDTPTVEEFRVIVSDALTLDQYVQLQNGALVAQFTDRNVNLENPDEDDAIDLELYKNQTLYKNIDKREESQVLFLKYCIVSYEIFRSYLRLPDVRLDHVLLWDLMTSTALFVNGLNLAILEMMENDITDKVKLVCPTNQFKRPLFDIQRPTVFLLKTDELYEPIYMVERRHNVETIYQKYFSLKKQSVGDTPAILKMVEELTNTQCKPYLKTKNASSVIKVKPNLVVSELYDELKKGLKVDVPSRIVNYQNKTIGLMAHTNNGRFFVPCHPSIDGKIDELTDLHFMDAPGLWNPYEKTVAFLHDTYAQSNHKIPCKPIYRIVEDGMTVGVLTQTNQFVQVDPPVQSAQTRDLPEYKMSNYLMIDQKIMKRTQDVSPETNKTMKYVYLENQFYNAFRTTMRILMRLYKNRRLMQKMQALCHKESMSMRKKRAKMEEYLHRLGDENVTFHAYDDEVLQSLYQIFTCGVNGENKKYCLMQDSPNTQGILMIPENHLLTEESNATIYYTRLADELLRHNRVHLFMFYPDQYLNIQSQEYQIEDATEMVVPKFLLTADYLQSLKANPYGDYSNTVPYDNTNTTELTRTPVSWKAYHKKEKKGKK